MPAFCLPRFFQSGGRAGNPCHSTHQQRKTSTNFPAKPRTGGGLREASAKGKRKPSRKEIMTANPKRATFSPKQKQEKQYKVNDLAAEEYRLMQAEQFIRSFRVTIEMEGRIVEVPMFVSISTDSAEGRGRDVAYRTNPLLESSKVKVLAERQIPWGK